jgi:peptide/nickel transport system substrate-binding protein
MIDSYSLDQGEIVLVRNPEFRQWSASRPDGFPDQIIFRLGPDSELRVNRDVDDTLMGNADVMFSSFSPERLAELASSHAGQLHQDLFAATRYMFLNTHIPPFDDPLARRALNYAVDRQMIVDEVWGASVRVTCQILPPTLPGYIPYCPYSLDPTGIWTAPDIPTARELVDRSGTAGTEVTVWAAPTIGGYGVPIGGLFVDLLDRLGYQANLKVVKEARYWGAIEDPSQGVQIAYSAWSHDFPAESGFIPGLTCGATGSPRYCDPTIERRMEQATNLQLTDPAGSHVLWSAIEHDLVDLAPWVPLGNPVWTSLVSERLENYQFHPFLGPLFDQMWVR